MTPLLPVMLRSPFNKSWVGYPWLNLPRLLLSWQLLNLLGFITLDLALAFQDGFFLKHVLSGVSTINYRVKTLEFNAGILSREAPVNPGLFLITGFLPSRNFSF